MPPLNIDTGNTAFRLLCSPGHANDAGAALRLRWPVGRKNALDITC